VTDPVRTLGMMATPRSTDFPALQLTWADGQVMAWQPGRGVYGGNLAYQVRQLANDAYRVTSQPMMRVLTLRLPNGEQNVMCQRLDYAAVDALAGVHAQAADVSPSVAWFGEVFRLVQRAVRRGHVAPLLHPLRGDTWAATWRLTDTARLPIDAAITPSMPPVVGAAGGLTSPMAIVDSMTDNMVRHELAIAGWRALLPDTRRPASRAMRSVANALADPRADRFQPHPEAADAVRAIAEQFQLMQRRAAGLPIVDVRLRLGLPDDDSEPGETPWPLTMELVDADDPLRSCTADDVNLHTEAARALARGAEHMSHLRDVVREAGDALVTAAPYLGPWLLDPHDGIGIDDAAALLEGIEHVQRAGIEIIAPHRLIRRNPTTSGAAQPAGGPGSGRFAAVALVDWQAVVDGEAIDDAVLQRAADDGATLIRIGGRWVQIDRAEARRALANLAEHRAQHSELNALELLRLAADDNGAELTAAAPADSAGPSWVGDLLAGLPDAQLQEGKVPDGFTATLRHYQLRGLGWLQFLHRVGLGGCLADDMGLGKTPTTLAHLAGVQGPHLVVCPLSVVRNWEAETARFAPLMRVLVHHGASRHGADAFARHVAEHDLVLTTYQVATRDLATLSSVNWSTVVLDEAQAVKNPATRTARAMRAIPAGQRIALTGTPVENRLSELWSILSTTTPGLLGNATSFKHRFANPIEKERDPAATEALRRLSGPFLLRRTKADKSLVPDLPDKIEQLAWSTLTREQAHLYQGVVDQLLHDAQQEKGMRRRGIVLAALTRLKQICNHPAHALGDGSKIAGRSGKLTRFDELVTDLLDADEQALIFTQFREMGSLLQQHLHEQFGHTVPFLHGGVAKTGRDRMVDQFQQGTATSPLLLVSLKAGGTGLNLTAASRVVHYDRWWNPAVEDQATDRAWRIGQTRSVFVHKLVCSGTVEERVDALINDKRALADAVIGGSGEAWLSELSTDALRDLVRLDRSAVGGAP
jgi:hypothetical protein